MDVADSGGASALQPMIWLEAGSQPNLLDQTTAPPAWKADVFAGQPGAWQGFNRAVAGLPCAGGAEAFGYGEIFAAEGGTAVDRKTFASRGIMPSTLEALRGRIPGLGGGIRSAPAARAGTSRITGNSHRENMGSRL